jgi:antagonist of KipI
MESVKVFRIVTPGPLTTVQDLGRIGFGRYGVARSGAVDGFSLRVANRLVGNPDTAAGLEITFMGPTLVALTPMVIAVTGGDLQPRINDLAVPMWQSIALKKEDRLSFKGPKSGLRAYLAVGGGIGVPTVLGSRSTNLGSGFGGLSGRALRKDDVLLSRDPHLHLTTVGASFECIPEYLPETVLRTIFGPQDHHFESPAKSLFEHSLYTVSDRSDRTGIRLKGPRIHAREGLDQSIISEGIVPGAIQIPGDGRPIILLGETATGGYRKMATVISADLHFLGQLRPENRVRFVPVSLDSAREALKEMEKTIQGVKPGAFP